MQKTFIENPPPARFLESTARFSADGTRRYELRRVWHPVGKSCCFIMLNPSTADDKVLDPTVTRCVGFAKSWGCNSLTVLNCFAFRATDPKELRQVVNPVSGPEDWYENDRTIIQVATQHDLIVCAWGTGAEFYSRESEQRFDRDHEVRRLLLGQKLWCLKLTQDGFPQHPLYMKGDAVPIPMPTFR